MLCYWKEEEDEGSIPAKMGIQLNTPKCCQENIIHTDTNCRFLQEDEHGVQIQEDEKYKVACPISW